MICSPVPSPSSASRRSHSFGCVSRMKASTVSGKIARSRSNPSRVIGNVPVGEQVRLDDGLEGGFGVPLGAHDYTCPPMRGIGFSSTSNEAACVPVNASRNLRRMAMSPSNTVHQMENIPRARAVSTICSRISGVS